MVPLRLLYLACPTLKGESIEVRILIQQVMDFASPCGRGGRRSMVTRGSHVGFVLRTDYDSVFPGKLGLREGMRPALISLLAAANPAALAGPER